MASSGLGGVNNKMISCEDFQQFQEALKKLRLYDDRIINALNAAIPTQSFASKIDAGQQCKELHSQIVAAQSHREKVIQHCLTEVNASVEKLRQEKSENPDNPVVIKTLRKEQNKLRLMRQEFNVEEVVRDNTEKAFYERCRNFYKPPS